MRRRSREQQREIAGIAVKPDAEIDLSEMPEVIDWSEAEVGKFYRPPKRPVTMRLDADVVEWLKSYWPGYQRRGGRNCSSNDVDSDTQFQVLPILVGCVNRGFESHCQRQASPVSQREAE